MFWTSRQTHVMLFVFVLLANIFISHVFSLQTPLEFPALEYVLRLPYANYTGIYDPYNDVVVFYNIRYAAPPTGELRWQKPHPPTTGMPMQGGTCYQACPEWSCGDPCNPQSSQARPYPRPGNDIPNPQQEDCLFLDVYVPRIAINNSSISPLPVLFWIHGGGYVEGTKDYYNGTSLIRASNNSIIYIAINYRLGAFGFLASPIVMSNGVPNAGLWDQRAALDWTVQYISLLNGNPSAITVVGESAGAGSILHHLTAPPKPLFQRAILQSPAFQAQWDNSPNGQLELQFRNFSLAAGCGPNDGLTCLRNKPEDVLRFANNVTIFPAPTGQSQYGPALDGNEGFAPNLPGVRLLNGQFDANIDIMVGHNSQEGFIFTPFIDSDEDFDEWVRDSFLSAPDAFPLQVDDFYPSPPQPDYWSDFGRLDLLISEGAICCNALYLSNAYGRSRTYNYYFDALLGFHGLDLCWTFDPTFKLLYLCDDICPWLRHTTNINAYQTYLVTFVKTGNPNFEGAPVYWTPFGTNGDVLHMDEWDLMYMMPDDEVPNDRCGFWQTAPYCKGCS